RGDREHAEPEPALGVKDERRRLAPGADTELGEARRQVALDGALRDVQLGGDLGVEETHDDKTQHLLLPSRERGPPEAVAEAVRERDLTRERRLCRGGEAVARLVAEDEGVGPRREGIARGARIRPLHDDEQRLLRRLLAEPRDGVALLAPEPVEAEDEQVRVRRVEPGAGAQDGDEPARAMRILVDDRRAQCSGGESLALGGKLRRYRSHVPRLEKYEVPGKSG